MDPQKAAENLAVIRHLMERPVKYTTQSGLSAVVTGIVALAGLVADRYFYRNFGPWHDAFWLNMLVWAGVFLIALSSVLGLTRLRELRQGLPFWTPARRKVLLTIIAPFVAGVGLTFAITCRWYAGVEPNEFGLIPSIWMLFYGLACWQVGQYSNVEIRVMGAAFILAGLITATLFQFNFYWSIGITFGGFHIIYGLVVWARHGG